MKLSIKIILSVMIFFILSILSYDFDSGFNAKEALATDLHGELKPKLCANGTDTYLRCYFAETTCNVAGQTSCPQDY